MKPERLTADNLADLGKGALRHMVNGALVTVMKDLEDRGGDMAKRTLTIKLEFGRVDEGETDIYIKARAQAGIPAYASPKTIAAMTMDEKGNYTASFQPNNPDRHDQPTMFDGKPGRPPFPKAAGDESAEE